MRGVETDGGRRRTQVWKGGRQARCRSGMEAEKEKVGFRVPTGLHTHLSMGEKSSLSRAGPLTGLARWALGDDYICVDEFISF
jgi:hypothetical protein